MSASPSFRSRAITDGDRFAASRPSSAVSASWKSPIETPRRQRIGKRIGSNASRLRVRRDQRGRMAEVKRMRSPLAPAPRSRSLTRCILTAPIPVAPERSGAWPCRTSLAVPHHPVAPVRLLHALHHGQKRLGFRRDGL
jgi:hypothetical protein